MLLSVRDAGRRTPTCRIQISPSPETRYTNRFTPNLTEPSVYWEGRAALHGYNCKAPYEAVAEIRTRTDVDLEVDVFLFGADFERFQTSFVWRN